VSHADAGLEHLARREPDKAAAAFRLALVADPKDLEAREGLARALVALGDHKGALDELNRVLSQDARRGSAERIRSEALMKLGRFDDAVFHLKRAMELDQGAS
jgi:Flp pilus assembly protein TadD